MLIPYTHWILPRLSLTYQTSGLVANLSKGSSLSLGLPGILLDTPLMWERSEHNIRKNAFSVLFSIMLVVIGTELLVFFSVFYRMLTATYPAETMVLASDATVLMAILILSLPCLASLLFAGILIHEMLELVVSKVVFTVTGLHFSHVIMGYAMILHNASARYSNGTYGYLQLSEDAFNTSYWKLVEGLWLIIAVLLFMLEL